MAESVKEELIRKLEGSTKALNESMKMMERYKTEVEILTVRCTDLLKALKGLEPNLEIDFDLE